MYSQTEIARFWSYVDKNGPVHPTLGNCWIWCRGKVKGYGWFHAQGKCHQTHRISWILKFGEVGEGICVLHKCDVPACVNPNHLFLGTRLDNNRDREKKGRAGDHKGEKNGRALLTEDLVRFIRANYVKQSKTHGQRALARRLRVGEHVIRDVIKLKSWSHVV